MFQKLTSKTVFIHTEMFVPDFLLLFSVSICLSVSSLSFCCTWITEVCILVVCFLAVMLTVFFNRHFTGYKSANWLNALQALWSLACWTDHDFFTLYFTGHFHCDGHVHWCRYIQRSRRCLFTWSPSLHSVGWAPFEKFPQNGWKSRCQNSTTKSKYMI